MLNPRLYPLHPTDKDLVVEQLSLPKEDIDDLKFYRQNMPYMLNGYEEYKNRNDSE